MINDVKTNVSPFHEGEQAVQARANVGEMSRTLGNAIKTQIPEGALNFIAQQSIAAVGSIDPRGQVWASILFGKRGFLRALDTQTLELDMRKTGLSADDPLWSNLKTNTQIGILLIDLGSRRRLRVNGNLHTSAGDNYRISVKQAYPNCPKYIQRRHLIITNRQTKKPINPTLHGTRLNTDQISLLENTDTFFVTSAHPNRGVDASHRGGQPGFIQVLNNRLLRIPDYAGNNMFNTLGNFHSYPYAGLVIIDHQANRLLQLTGTTETEWHLSDPNDDSSTKRHWTFEITAWQERTIPSDIDWEFLDYSPHNPQRHNV